MLLIYPLLGIDAFDKATEETSAPDEGADLFLDERGAKGRGRETRDGFVVFSGSLARSSTIPSIQAYQEDLRRRLMQRGVLVAETDGLRFTQDYRFNSPTMAAAVLVGGNANGRVAWKTDRGQTLKSIQEARGGP